MSSRRAMAEKGIVINSSGKLAEFTFQFHLSLMRTGALSYFSLFAVETIFMTWLDARNGCS